MRVLEWSARAVVALPALAALVGLVLPRAARRWQAGVALAGGVGALAAAVVQLVVVHAGVRMVTSAGDPAGVTGVLLLPPVPTGNGTVELVVRADGLTAVVAVMVSVVAIAVQVYSVGYQAGDRRYRGYAATVSLFTAAMLLVVHADDLLLLLIGWEAMGLCSYLLVGHESERPAARAAAVKAFLVTRVGDVAFVVGVLMLWVAGRTTTITDLLRPEKLQQIGTPTLTAAAILLVVGVVGKSAQFPLHTWLPDAMEGPTPVSALIHAATMVAAGGVVLARLLPVLQAAPGARAVLAVVTAVTMLGAALVACCQDDLKRVLAWSTISQVGYLLAALAVVGGVDEPVTGATSAGAGAGAGAGMSAGAASAGASSGEFSSLGMTTAGDGLGAAPSVVHLLSHAGFKALLFLAAGVLARQVGSTAFIALRGAGRRCRWAAASFSVGLAALAGVPPLSGFWSKEAVVGAAEQAALAGPQRWIGWLVMASALLTGLVTAGYATRTWWMVVADPVPAPSAGATSTGPESAAVTPVGPVPAAATSAAPIPASMAVPVVALVLPAALGGLLLLDPVVPGDVHLTGVTAAIAAGLTVLGVVMTSVFARDGDPVRVLPGRVRRALAAGLGLDAAQHWLVVRPVQALARVVTAGDRDVVDAYVRAAGAGAGLGGRLLRRTQTGVVTGYLGWVLGGVVVAVVAGLGWGAR
ncbi:MAG: NADH-quinone oxidoreductase subunit 5 family protein [Angustibacter sp.]